MKRANRAGWRQIGGKLLYLKSAAEQRYASYLQWLMINKVIWMWYYEPKTFWFEGIKRGVVSYKPDFKIVNNDETQYWVEVKGYMDGKSKTKIKRFAKYFPKETLIVVDKNWFARNSGKLKGLVPGWE